MKSSYIQLTASYIIFADDINPFSYFGAHPSDRSNKPMRTDDDVVSPESDHGR